MDPETKKTYRQKTRSNLRKKFLESGKHWTEFVKAKPKTHTCVECGLPFQSFQRKASICGPKCNKAFKSRIAKQNAAKVAAKVRKFATKADRHKFYLYKRRAIVAQQKIEKFAADEIFDRDNWACGICGFAVDKALTYPHPYSATLDHIIPVSSGGGHIRENVQCAHWICNMRKGKKYGSRAS